MPTKLKLGCDSFEVLRELRPEISRVQNPEKRVGKRDSIAEKEEKPKKPTALERFGRDLTALAAEGALSPLIGRRAELIRMTQVLLQSRKNNLEVKAETLKR